MADGWQWDADDFDDDGGGEDSADGDAIKVRANRPLAGSSLAMESQPAHNPLLLSPHFSPRPPGASTLGCSNAI